MGRCAVFGYIQIFEPELKIREYKCYRGAYCGLCRQMGKCTGQCSRLTLRYDAAAMVLLRMAARGTQPIFVQKRCFLHPSLESFKAIYQKKVENRVFLADEMK